MTLAASVVQAKFKTSPALAENARSILAGKPYHSLNSIIGETQFHSARCVSRLVIS